MKTLWDLAANQSAVVDTIDTQLTTSVISRLEEMGFSEGQCVLCIRRSPFKGPLVVQIGDCVYSLEQSVADKINLALAS
ncbi:ferrous iron transport protein A [Idiomarina fontislapidosi]|uniref:Ferrous iron transport protein A n=1 Tax=Idiomarina fontislapidosi TaxID=263723 RepID=A0A432Y8V1_9GAMM|nr:FeoA family protein [Idiomarina fontislapidosi]PYE34639.1 ferrous iron transport protein A [Idiomarina fontislapidosi]RUO57409.1 ferrous iron transport protein A [Idiomarina fontislapidosi]